MSTNTLRDELTSNSLADDLLRGVKSIAEFIGESERKTFYLCERGYIPHGKLGTHLVASKTALRRHFAQITGAAA
jgi:hypothetical protein